jgi:hypothetical protein
MFQDDFDEVKGFPSEEELFELCKYFKRSHHSYKILDVYIVLGILDVRSPELQQSNHILCTFRFLFFIQPLYL